MNLEINQRQNRELLEEHAKSSFNFGLIGKSELYIAVSFLLIGVFISILNESNRFIGLPFIAIGIFEIIKYPTGEKRWVRKKEKEKIFNKDIQFEIVNDTLKITYDKAPKTYSFAQIRKCLISETGILFKISLSEYYYISFKALSSEIEQEDLINHLKKEFEEGKIKVNRVNKNEIN